MEEDNQLWITDDDGQEYRMEIVMRFSSPDQLKNFVLIKDPDAESEDTYAYSFDEDGNMYAVEDADELELCAEMLDAYNSFEGGETHDA